MWNNFTVADEIWRSEWPEVIAGKKARLDRLRPAPAEAVRNLERYYDLEITYTPNAIEANTLSAVETTLVIEKGITIAGNPLKDHLEANAGGAGK